MLIDKILPHLGDARQTAPNQWIAKCPSHEDKSPSLAIKEADDRLLLHCFAGCSPHEVVNAIGLEITDLFPEREASNKPIRKPFSPSTLLKIISHETLIVTCAAHDLAEGLSLAPEDHSRLVTAAARLYRAANYGGIAQ